MPSLPKSIRLLIGCLLLTVGLNCKADAGVIIDIAIPSLSADFNRTSGELNIRGVAMFYTSPTGGINQRLYGNGANFLLSASFDASQNFVSGNFEVKGTTVSPNNAAMRNTTFLAGTLTEARWSVDSNDLFNSNVMEMFSNNLSGTVASVYGRQAQLNINGAFFGHSFLSDYNLRGAADIVRPVPEPATLSCMFAVLFVGCRRRRQKPSRGSTSAAALPTRA